MTSSLTQPSSPKRPRSSRFIEGVPVTDIPSSTTMNPLFYTILSEQDHHESRSRSRSQSHSRHNSNSSTSSTNVSHTGLLGPPVPFSYLTSEPLPLPQTAPDLRNPTSAGQPGLDYTIRRPRALSRNSETACDRERERERRISEESAGRQEQEQRRRESKGEKLVGRFRALTLGNREKDVQVEAVCPVTERMVLE